jgi:aspartyl aminopeptidase
MNRDNQWVKYSDSQLKELNDLAENYKRFMTAAKTERECVKEAVKLAEAAGCRNLEDVIAKGESLKAGDRVYAVWMKKTMALFTIGRQPLEKGMRILGAHIDSPRLDLKQNPLYEDTEMAYLDLHYYGGIKKYQWTAIPLAIHGVVAKKDGSLAEIVIGEKEGDPVFCVTDLLIHLAAKQMEKPLSKGVEGENLDLLIGSRPIVIKNDSEQACAEKENVSDSADAGDKKASASASDLVKKMVLQILKEHLTWRRKIFSPPSWKSSRQAPPGIWVSTAAWSPPTGRMTGYAPIPPWTLS